MLYFLLIVLAFLGIWKLLSGSSTSRASLVASNQSRLRLFDEEAVMKQIDRSTLEMALIGYEAERQKIEAVMAAIRKQVHGHAAAPAVDGARRPKRVMSAAARRRIAAAQRKRWAVFHAGQKSGTAILHRSGNCRLWPRLSSRRNLTKARAAKAAKVKRMAKAA
jgi:hypothetical protein